MQKPEKKKCEKIVFFCCVSGRVCYLLFMTETQSTTTIDCNATAEFIIAQLNGATIRYTTNKGCNVRNFRVVNVEVVGFSKKGNRRFVNVLCEDIDDADEKKNRTLHVEGIELAK